MHARRSVSADLHSDRSDRRRQVPTNWFGVRGIEYGAGTAPTGPPSEHSSYVGRVAALAVTLGVGAAIASLPAVAFADATDSGGSANPSSSSEAKASSNGSSAESTDSESSEGTTSSSPNDSSFGEDREATSAEAADADADIDADIDDAERDADSEATDIDDADEPADAALDSSASESANTDIAGAAVPTSEDSGSDNDPLVDDSVPLNVATLNVTTELDEQTSGEGSGASVTATANHEAHPSDDAYWTGDTLGAASGDGSPLVGSAVADDFWLFGNGTAEHPNGGILFGSGFSWDANSCTGTSACHGGSAGFLGGSGGDGFNGGDGGSAGWFGSGGDGGDGIPGGNGGNGGRGGLFFGSGGNGGDGGAARDSSDTPGLGGSGGSAGLFGTKGQAGTIGASFPGEASEPAVPVAPSLAFDFVYGDGSQYWSSAARNALEAAALSLSSYIVVESPVTLTYDVSGEWSPLSSNLASASSALSGASTGFFNTVVQEKIQSGVDANGNAADGHINFNFGRSWSTDNSVGRSQYDLQSTATHELLHTLGLISLVGSAGSNTSRNWTAFDSFIVTNGDVNVIGSDYRWDTAYNSNLTGGNGGLYFGGSNAVAAYDGQLVPLYTPNSWKSGSSVTHLDDASFSGGDAQLMNAIVKTGPGIRTLSPVELGILADLGYVISSPQQTSAVLFFTILFARRRRKVVASAPC